MKYSSNFQIMVWKEIEKIPYGKTRTYKDIAVSIGKPNAYRAVAKVCGKNPLPIIRPCHRVICTDGSLGGYSPGSGKKLKRALIKLESN